MTRTRAVTVFMAALLVASLGPLGGCTTPASVCSSILDQLMECSGADWEPASQTAYLADCEAEIMAAEGAVPVCYDAFLELGSCVSELDCGDFEGVWDDGACQDAALAVFGNEECMEFYPF